MAEQYSTLSELDLIFDTLPSDSFFHLNQKPGLYPIRLHYFSEHQHAVLCEYDVLLEEEQVPVTARVMLDRVRPTVLFSSVFLAVHRDQKYTLFVPKNSEHTQELLIDVRKAQLRERQ